METYKLIEELEKLATELETEAAKPEPVANNKVASEDNGQAGSAYIDTLVKAMGL